MERVKTKNRREKENRRGGVFVEQLGLIALTGTERRQVSQALHEKDVNSSNRERRSLDCSFWRRKQSLHFLKGKRKWTPAFGARCSPPSFP